MSGSPKTKLVNYRTYKLNKSKITPIDRRSIFGNPFIIGKDEDGTREEVIKLYKNMFGSMIKSCPQFRKNIFTLKGKTLGCWCTPLPCHGDVIIEYLNGLETEGLE